MELEPNLSGKAELQSHDDASPAIGTHPWDWWRSQMPIVESWSYLDHAAVGPLSGPAAAAIEQYARQATREGDTVWPQWAANLDQLRRGFAELLNAESDEICLIPNTSTGINLIAEGFPWQPGDSVVVPEGEFPSNHFPWQNQAWRGVQLRLVPRRQGRVLIDDLFSQVDRSTRMIAVSWVGYASGFRVELDELVERAHRLGVLVCLDAIQGAGVFDLDLREIDVDFLAADGHKWLLGPEGMGFAMIRKRHIDRLRCGNVGWNSVRNAFNYADPKMDLRSSAVRFEPGSANMVGAAALLASLKLFLEVRRIHGPNAIENRVLELANELHQRLIGSIGIASRMPPSPRIDLGS